MYGRREITSERDRNPSTFLAKKNTNGGVPPVLLAVYIIYLVGNGVRGIT